jgi:long-chain acyl-CoA synthetase
MAGSGETVSYGELERAATGWPTCCARRACSGWTTTRVFMENHPRYAETCVAGERAGLYYTCINSYLKAEELAYILDNSHSQVLITSPVAAGRWRAGAGAVPARALCLVVDDGARRATTRGCVDYASAVAAMPRHAHRRRALGTSMLYSSGTTGRPKGILRPLPDEPPPSEPLPLFGFLQKLWQCREGMVYLSPAPLYHSAPLAHRGRGPAHRRHGHRHGALRPRAVPGAGREAPRHPHAAGADDVQPHAQAAGRGAQRATTCRRWRSPCTPPRPARCRSRSR